VIVRVQGREPIRGARRRRRVTQYSYERFLSDVFGMPESPTITQRQTEQASLIAPDKDEHGALVTERDAERRASSEAPSP